MNRRIARLRRSVAVLTSTQAHMHVFVAPFPRAKRSFGARGVLIRLIFVVVTLDFVESRQREYSRSCLAKKVISMARITAGLRRKGCATLTRCQQQQQQQ